VGRISYVPLEVLVAEWTSLAEADSVQFAQGYSETQQPSAAELAVLRQLKARTAAAHGLGGEAA